MAAQFFCISLSSGHMGWFGSWSMYKKEENKWTEEVSWRLHTQNKSVERRNSKGCWDRSRMPECHYKKARCIRGPRQRGQVGSIEIMEMLSTWKAPMSHSISQISKLQPHPSCTEWNTHRLSQHIPFMCICVYRIEKENGPYKTLQALQVREREVHEGERGGTK